MYSNKALVKNWRETGLIAEGCSGNNTYFSTPGGMGCKELDAICDELNAEWEAEDSHLRVGWYAGEFHPRERRQRDLI